MAWRWKHYLGHVCFLTFTDDEDDEIIKSRAITLFKNQKKNYFANLDTSHNLQAKFTMKRMEIIASVCSTHQQQFAVIIEKKSIGDQNRTKFSFRSEARKKCGK